MKKILAFVMAAVILASLAVSASATNKADLLAEAAKSPVYKYIKVSVENAARTVEVTDEQAAQILPIVKRGVAILDKDNGPGVHDAQKGYTYTAEQVEGVMECIDEICAILGFTYKMIPSTNAKHVGDGIFTVYDAQGKIVFEYDGDVVADTDAATTENTVIMTVAASVLLALGAAAIAVSKKRSIAE